MNKAIEMFVYFLKHMGDLRINSGFPTLEKSFGKLREDKLVLRRVYKIGVCHGPVPVVKKTLSQDRYIPPDRLWT